MSFLTPVQLPISGTTKLNLYAVYFAVDEFDFNLFQQLNIGAPQQIQNSVKKRQAEFLAGRYCAHQALKNLGSRVSQIEIGNNRAPVWPDNVIGSITHCDDLAISCALDKSSGKRLGIDVENLITEDTVEQIISSVVNEQEIALLQQLSMPFNQAFTMVFSAKESLFKALYPEVKKYFDFLDAQVQSISLEQGRFTLVLNKNLNQYLTIGCQFKGHFTWLSKQRVVTLIQQ